jgi:carboxyl-terminal processing protease
MRGLSGCLLSVALAAGSALAEPTLSARQYAEDFDTLWRALDQGYAYFDHDRSSWKRVRETWRPRAARAVTPAQFVAVLEGALVELRDDHVGLSESAPQSPRRVPADTDIWAGWKDAVAVVEAVRAYSDADVAGLRPGHVIVRIGGLPVERAVRNQLGGATGTVSQRDWALRHALAGPRAGVLTVEVAEGRGTRKLDIERTAPRAANGAPLVGRRMGEDRDLGYIRIKASLADPELPAQFDHALDRLASTRALILDLRELSGPGSSAAIEAIVARFAAAPAAWQLREPRGGKRSADSVAPRATPYRAPVAVLVDRWTAGAGEALAVGIAAVGNARLVGTSMAGLRGESSDVRLPHSGIVVRFPTQKTFHPDGTPREAVKPAIAVDLAAPQAGPGDPILYQALKLFERK